MFKSVWDVADKRKMEKVLKAAEKEVKNNFLFYWDEFAQCAEYIVETWVSERAGCYGAGEVLVDVYGVTFDDISESDELREKGMTEEEIEFLREDYYFLVEFLSQLEGCFDWIDSLEDNFNDELKEFAREIGLEGHVCLTWHEGAYELMYYNDNQENLDEEE